MADQALLKAVSSARYTQTKLLLQMGADVNCQDEAGQTPLIRALFLEDPRVRANILRLLLRSGALVSTEDSRERNALMWACTVSPYPDFLLLLRHADVDLNINNKNTTGHTALWIAVDLDKVEIVKELLKELTKHELNVEVPDKEGVTPAMRAAMLGHYNCLRVIISHFNNAGKTINNVINVTKIQNILRTIPFISQPQTVPDSPGVVSRPKTTSATPATRVTSTEGHHVLNHAGSAQSPRRTTSGDLELYPDVFDEPAKCSIPDPARKRQAAQSPDARPSTEACRVPQRRTKGSSGELQQQKASPRRSTKSKGSSEDISKPKTSAVPQKSTNASLNDLSQQKACHPGQPSRGVNGANEGGLSGAIQHRDPSHSDQLPTVPLGTLSNLDLNDVRHPKADRSTDASPAVRSLNKKEDSDQQHKNMCHSDKRISEADQSPQVSPTLLNKNQQELNNAQSQTATHSAKVADEFPKDGKLSVNKSPRRKASHSRERAPVLLKTEEGGLSSMRDRKVRSPTKARTVPVSIDKPVVNSTLQSWDEGDASKAKHLRACHSAKHGAMTQQDDEQAAKNLEPNDNDQVHNDNNDPTHTDNDPTHTDDHLERPAEEEPVQMSPSMMRTDKWASETVPHFKSSHSIQVSFSPPTAGSPHSVQISFLPATEKSPHSVHVSFSRPKDKSSHSAHILPLAPTAKSPRSAQVSFSTPKAKACHPAKVSFSPNTAISHAVSDMLHHKLNQSSLAADKLFRKDTQAENTVPHSKVRHCAPKTAVLTPTDRRDGNKQPYRRLCQSAKGPPVSHRLCQSAKGPPVSHRTEERGWNQPQLNEARQCAPAYPVQNGRSVHVFPQQHGSFQRGLNYLPQHARHQSAKVSLSHTFMTDAHGRTPTPHIARRECKTSHERTRMNNDPYHSSNGACKISYQALPMQNGLYLPPKTTSREHGRALNDTVITGDGDQRDVLPQWKRSTSIPNITTFTMDQPTSIVYPPARSVTRPSSVRDTLPKLFDIYAEHKTPSFRKMAVKPKPPTPPRPKPPPAIKKLALFGGKKWSKLRGIHILTRGLSKGAMPSPKAQPRSPLSPNPASEAKPGGVAASVLAGLFSSKRKTSQGSSPAPVQEKE
ncbi:uncharacterized protein [Littorina saxatilis]|uniref:Uncharacterized protein n=1 Tax=Littorina saxatilis TaxID=31220 RepID=A0AAN9BXU4_9CAEN